MMDVICIVMFFFFSSRRRHTRFDCDWSSDVCSSDLPTGVLAPDFSSDPAACPAVAGGNVETSQRIVDVLLRAFGVAACSQGRSEERRVGKECRSRWWPYQ